MLVGFFLYLKFTSEFMTSAVSAAFHSELHPSLVWDFGLWFPIFIENFWGLHWRWVLLGFSSVSARCPGHLPTWDRFILKCLFKVSHSKVLFVWDTSIRKNQLVLRILKGDSPPPPPPPIQRQHLGQAGNFICCLLEQALADFCFTLTLWVWPFVVPHYGGRESLVEPPTLDWPLGSLRSENEV